MSSYYKPSIEDFHVGFEYESEEDPIQGKWEKQKVNDYRDLINCMNYYGRDSDVDTRVKYLDREDIEELGFETEDNGVCYDKLKSFNLYGLHSWEWDKGVSNQYKIFFNSSLLFNGIIKNKSELKILLKQLNINE